MTSNEKLIQTIINNMNTMEGDDDKKGDYLKALFNDSSNVEKQLIDRVLIILTGWSLPTLIKMSIEN